jgi:hypothetical protein
MLGSARSRCMACAGRCLRLSWGACSAAATAISVRSSSCVLRACTSHVSKVVYSAGMRTAALKQRQTTQMPAIPALVDAEIVLHMAQSPKQQPGCAEPGEPNQVHLTTNSESTDWSQQKALTEFFDGQVPASSGSLLLPDQCGSLAQITCLQFRTSLCLSPPNRWVGSSSARH